MGGPASSDAALAREHSQYCCIYSAAWTVSTMLGSKLQ